jgi:hypothetical protein
MEDQSSLKDAVVDGSRLAAISENNAYIIDLSTNNFEAISIENYDDILKIEKKSPNELTFKSNIAIWGA